MQHLGRTLAVARHTCSSFRNEKCPIALPFTSHSSQRWISLSARLSFVRLKTIGELD